MYALVHLFYYSLHVKGTSIKTIILLPFSSLLPLRGEFSSISSVRRRCSPSGIFRNPLPFWRPPTDLQNSMKVLAMLSGRKLFLKPESFPSISLLRTMRVFPPQVASHIPLKANLGGHKIENSRPLLNALVTCSWCPRTLPWWTCSRLAPRSPPSRRSCTRWRWPCRGGRSGRWGAPGRGRL